MKRIGNLFEKVISLDNLRLADEKARKGKLGTYGVQLHDKHREENILALHESLKNGTFRTSYIMFLQFSSRRKVKHNYQVFPVDARGIDYLGYVFFHTHTLLRKSIKKKLCRRVAKLNKRKRKPTKTRYKQQICSWWGWCKYCDSVNLINKLSKQFPYEIRFNRS